MPVPHSYRHCALLMLASALAASPVKAQLPDLCGTASRAQCRRTAHSYRPRIPITSLSIRAADLGISPVRYLTVGGSVEVIRRPGSDVPWWFLGVRLRWTTEEAERLAFLLVGAGFIATLIRDIVN